MKISKTTVLALWVMFSAASLWLILVDAWDVDVLVDPSNAIQHIKNVRFISTWNTAFATMKAQNKNNIVQISMDGNFILSKTWDLSKAWDDEINMILGSGLSSILWWIKNKIWENFRWNSVILAWSGNGISSWGYSVILWWEWNNIVEPASTIVWGRDNAIGTKGEGFFWNVIIWWENSRVLASYSVAAWNNNEVAWNSSVALGSWAILGVDNTFLWTNSESVEGLGVNDVFVVDANSGMVVNEDRAHSFARLTLWWALSVFSNVDDENIQCGGWVGWWILKAVTTDTNQMCLCSCDGSGWNSMFARGRCVGACNWYMEPECGNTVERVCGEDWVTYSWSCVRSKAINGEGSYLVDKNNKIHRSCQADDGSVKYCSGFVSSAVTECIWYCEWDLPLNSHLNWRAMTTWNNVSFFYDSEWTGDCSYSCNTGFNYVMQDNEGKCIKCKAGTYNTGKQTCEEEAVCEYPTVPYNGLCIHLGNCMEKASLLNLRNTEQYSLTNSEWYSNGENLFLPYGAQEEMPWSCKQNSEDVNLHSCEFSCKPGYHCSYWTGSDGRNGYYCSSDNVGCRWFSTKYSPDHPWSRIYFPEYWVMRWHHPIDYDWAVYTGGDNYLKTEYVDSMEEFNNLTGNFATWCYSFCDSGFHQYYNNMNWQWKCLSNCRSMYLGWKTKQGKPIDVHAWEWRYTTWWFHNWRFNWLDKKWTYVAPWVLDDAIANDTWICLWTCRSWIPITGLQNKTPFKDIFNYNRGAYDYNTCWEKCPDNYYFSWFLCVPVSTSEYVPDHEKIITYWDIWNSYAQRKACGAGETYDTGNHVCMMDVVEQVCPEWYEKVDGVCMICPDGWWFTGYNHECVEYNRCDVNHNRRINLNDKVSIYNCTMSWTLCNWRENLDGMWGVNSGDLEYFDEICTTKLDYNMCDINDDWLFDTNDTNYISQYLFVCQNMNNCSLVYDFDGNWEVNISDVTKFWDICVRQGW